ncbi:MAG: 30S ribosome-binding factor RbfA [Pseudomonadota bacterium]
MANRFQKTAGPSQRQLRAGELLRHALAEMFQRGEVHATDLPQTPVTFTEVKISPDLKAATVFCAFLGKDDVDTEISQLNRASVAIRHVLGRKVQLKYTPSLVFRKDETFDEVARISALLKESGDAD